MVKTLIWIFRVIVFVALFGLALKNSALVELRFYFDQRIDAPLSLMVLGIFVLGVAVGLTAASSTLLRQRRELSRLRSGRDLLRGA